MRFIYWYAECHNAECRYPECRQAKCHYIEFRGARLRYAAPKKDRCVEDNSNYKDYGVKFKTR